MTTTFEDRLAATREALELLEVPQPAGVQRPPGPSSARSMARLLTRRVAPYQLFTEISSTHHPIGHVKLGGAHLYLLSDPDVIWQGFVGEAKSLAKGRGLQFTRPLLGDGLLTSEGAVHLRNRRLVQPVFHRQRIRGYADGMVAATNRVSHRWRRMSGGSPVRVDVVQQMSGLTLDVVGSTLFGDDLTGNAGDIGRSLDVVLAGFTRMMRPGALVAMRVATPARTRMITAVDRLDTVIAALIARKRAEVAAGHPGADVLSLLLQTVDEETGESLSDQEIRDETMTMVLAGHETTAMALSWALRDLTMNPSALQWLREEVDNVDPEGFDALPQLPRTYAVIAEGMRLHPPAWVVGRYVTAPINLAGYDVPPGTSILASQYAMHRDPRFWPDPWAFRPQRWISPTGSFDERTPDVPRGTWFPFGFGTRRCIGEQFAWVEAVLALAGLIRQWDIRVLAPEQVRPLAAVTLRPRDGMPAVLRPR